MKETLKKQNEVIFKYRDWLKKELSKKDLTLLFEFNQQETPKGEDSVRIKKILFVIIRHFSNLETLQ